MTELESILAAAKGHDAIVHLAGIPGPGRASPERLVTQNLAGIVNVLEAAVQAGAGKVVFASSAAALGFSFQKSELIPSYFPIDEQHKCRPQDPYGLSKLLGESACQSYSDAYGIRTICLRLNNVWYTDRAGASLVVQSGWAKGLSVEQLWAARYQRSLEDTSQDWPSPGPVPPKKNLWAVTDARDIGQAFQLALASESVGSDVFLINGSDTCATVPTGELLAQWYPAVPVKRPLPSYASLFSHQKATQLLGFQPRFSWRDSDFADWFRSTCSISTGCWA